MAQLPIESKLYITTKSKTIDRANMTMEIVATERVVDREGDILEPMGADIKAYLNNPVVLAFHDSHRQPIGKTLNITIDENRIIMKIQFKDRGEAKDIFDDYAEGFMNTWSLGFVPKEDGFEKIWSEPDENGEATFQGFHIKEWELLEVSAVPIPANPRAITLSKSLDKILNKKTPDIITAENEKKPKEEKESYACECLDCGHKLTSDKHCKDIPCPKCGGKMRREERPGAGQRGFIVDACLMMMADKTGTPIILDGKEFILAQKALKKSILERGAANKIPYIITEVENMTETGIVLECEALDFKEGRIEQAKIMKIEYKLIKGSTPPLENSSENSDRNEITNMGKTIANIMGKTIAEEVQEAEMTMVGMGFTLNIER